MSGQYAIAIEDLEFGYTPGQTILRIPHFTIKRGERVFLFGPSGSGKTTLLGLVTGILRPSQGKLSILGCDTARLSGRKRDQFRGAHIGYIFQMFNLIPYLSVLENIMLPCQLNSTRKDRVGSANLVSEAKKLAESLGLAHVLDHSATRLSVGQQQRVAAARALLGAPEIIIADEPTSALDADVREAFLTQLFTAADAEKSTILFVSHDASLKSHFDRSVSLSELNTCHRG